MAHRQLRAGRRRRRRAGPRRLRLPPRRPGRDPLPEAGRPVLPEPAPLCRLGRPVLRHRRTPASRRPALPRRPARHHPARRAAGDRRRHLPPGVVARPRRRSRTRGRAAAVGRRRPRVRRPRHRRAAAHLRRRRRAADPPAHVVTFGPQVHVKGILGGTEEAGRHIGYLTKYLTKSVSQAAGLAERRHRAAARAPPPAARRAGAHPVLAALPDLAALRRAARRAPARDDARGGARARPTPEHLGYAGRRVLVSRKWSNKTLDDHHAERTAFVRQLLIKAGVRPGYAVDDGPFAWEKPDPGTPTSPQAGAAAARDQPAAALESRLPRRPTRGRRTTGDPFGNRGDGGPRPPSARSTPMRGAG